MLTLCLGTTEAAAQIQGCETAPIPGPTQVRVDTPLGAMLLELYPNVAPVTVANFLGYVERGDYTNTIVHRSEPGFVIQAGGYASSGITFEAIDTLPAIQNEPCRSNRQGTIAMARVGGRPNSATSQWFVNLVDNPGLDGVDGGFTVFGRVIEGFDVALAIAALADRPPDLWPTLLVDIEPPIFPAFKGSPLRTPLDIQQTCFDPLEPGVVLVQDPLSPLDLEPSVAFERSYTLASPACATGGSGSGAPTTPCSDPGRRVMRVDPVTLSLVPDASAPFGFAEVSMSCDAIAASDAAYALHLEQIGAQLATALVHTEYTLVPEPGSALSGAVALLCAALLARRKRSPGQSAARGPSISAGRTQAS